MYIEHYVHICISIDVVTYFANDCLITQYYDMGVRISMCVRVCDFNAYPSRLYRTVHLRLSLLIKSRVTPLVIYHPLII